MVVPPSLNRRAAGRGVRNTPWVLHGQTVGDWPVPETLHRNQWLTNSDATRDRNSWTIPQPTARTTDVVSRSVATFQTTHPLTKQARSSPANRHCLRRTIRRVDQSTPASRTMSVGSPTRCDRGDRDTKHRIQRAPKWTRKIGHPQHRELSCNTRLRPATGIDPIFEVAVESAGIALLRCQFRKTTSFTDRSVAPPPGIDGGFSRPCLQCPHELLKNRCSVNRIAKSRRGTVGTEWGAPFLQEDAATRDPPLSECTSAELDCVASGLRFYAAIHTQAPISWTRESWSAG